MSNFNFKLPHFRSFSERIAEADRKARIETAYTRFTIRRIDGVDYITDNNIRISLPEDAQDPARLMDRLEFIRKSYIN